MERFSRLVENVANLAIVATCAVVLVTLSSRLLTTNKPAPPSPSRGAPLQAGEKFPSNIIASAYFQEAQRTLLVYVKSGCSFCDASGPFYRRLAQDVRVAPEGSTRLAVVTTDVPAAVEQYLSDSGLTRFRTFNVSKETVKELRLPGTPALVLVDSSGVIEKVWVGKLNERGEANVISTLFGTPSVALSPRIDGTAGTLAMMREQLR